MNWVVCFDKTFAISLRGAFIDVFAVGIIMVMRIRIRVRHSAAYIYVNETPMVCWLFWIWSHSMIMMVFSVWNGSVNYSTDFVWNATMKTKESISTVTKYGCLRTDLAEMGLFCIVSNACMRVCTLYMTYIKLNIIRQS